MRPHTNTNTQRRNTSTQTTQQPTNTRTHTRIERMRCVRHVLCEQLRKRASRTSKGSNQREAEATLLSSHRKNPKRVFLCLAFAFPSRFAINLAEPGVTLSGKDPQRKRHQKSQGERTDTTHRTQKISMCCVMSWRARANTEKHNASMEQNAGEANNGQHATAAEQNARAKGKNQHTEHFETFVRLRRAP
jgi:hypothetical protein